MSEPSAVAGVEDCLAAIATALYDAADLAQASARRDGSASPDQLWALGLSVLAAQTVTLMADPSVLDTDTAVTTGSSATGMDGDFLGLLRAAFELACVLPLDPQYPGISALIVAIGDLTRQAAA